MKKIRNNTRIRNTDVTYKSKEIITDRIKGSFSIEAAIVLPIFLFAIFAVSFLIKIIYIEEKIEAAMTETARQMSTGAYAITYIGILDEIEEYLYKSINSNKDLKNNMKDSFSIIDGLAEFQVNNEIGNKEEEASIINKAEDGEIENSIFSEKILQFNDEKSLQKSLNSKNSEQSANILVEIISFIKESAVDAEGLVYQEGKDKAIQIVKNYTGTSIARLMMNNAIKDEEIKNWGVVNGKKGIDYSKSEFFVQNDIKLVATYEIEIPLMNKLIKPFSVTQEVKVRAYIGDGNFEARLNRSGEKEEEDEIVYITRTGTKYHNSKSCRYIDVKILPVRYQEVKKSKAICEVCAREKRILDNSTIVFSTQDSDIFHVSNKCRTIYRDIIPIELEEAVKKGYKPCSKCGR